MMKAKSFEKNLRALLNRQPFHPFAIEFDDGAQFTVAEPKALWYIDGGTAVYLRRDGSLDLVNCKAVKHFQEVAPVVSNGSGQRGGGNP